jgi:hypothetical protein
MTHNLKKILFIIFRAQREKSSSVLIPKNKKSIEFCERLTKRNARIRPDYEQILMRKNDLAVDNEDYSIRKQFDIVRKNNKDLRNSFTVFIQLLVIICTLFIKQEHVFGVVNVNFL